MMQGENADNPSYINGCRINLNASTKNIETYAKRFGPQLTLPKRRIRETAQATLNDLQTISASKKPIQSYRISKETEGCLCHLF